jgi:hypothetical protein
MASATHNFATSAVASLILTAAVTANIVCKLVIVKQCVSLEEVLIQKEGKPCLFRSQVCVSLAEVLILFPFLGT